MTILCIESSTSVCSAAICKDGVPVKQCICLEGSNHARLLPRYIEDLLSFAREQSLSIEAVALSEGPGSYTGLRIGTSTAKGLCYGLNIPLIPVPTLEVLCQAAKRRISDDSCQMSEDRGKKREVLVPMIDARRMEVYTKDMIHTMYKGNNGTGAHNAKAVVVENEETLCAGIFEHNGLATEQFFSETEFYYFGDGAAKCQEVLSSPNWHYIPGIVPEAQYMGGLAEEKINGREDEWNRVLTGERIAYYEPYYLKEFVAAQSHVKGLKS